jgi:hypothetical protein
MSYIVILCILGCKKDQETVTRCHLICHLIGKGGQVIGLEVAQVTQFL